MQVSRCVSVVASRTHFIEDRVSRCFQGERRAEIWLHIVPSSCKLRKGSDHVDKRNRFADAEQVWNIRT